MSTTGEASEILIWNKITCRLFFNATTKESRKNIKCDRRMGKVQDNRYEINDHIKNKEHLFPEFSVAIWYLIIHRNDKWSILQVWNTRKAPDFIWYHVYFFFQIPDKL